MKRLLIILSLFFVIPGCTQSPPPADSSAITSRSEAWEAALNAQDLDALVAFYTDDARLLAPNKKMARGGAAVGAEFGAMIDAGISGDLTSVDTVVSGDIGYNVGTFTLSMGGAIIDTGKFIETWRRDSDGKWRISNDIYNSDMPAPMPATAEAKSHIMISHEVDDADRWMAAWRGDNSRHKLFKDHGAAHVHTFRSPDNPNLTGLVIAVNDMAMLEAMLTSDAGIAAAAEDGVRRETMVIMPQAE